MTLCSTRLLSLTALPVGCSSLPLENASKQCQDNKEYKSLKIISEHLSKRTPRNEGERLLGEPGYSPTDGSTTTLRLCRNTPKDRNMKSRWASLSITAIRAAL